LDAQKETTTMRIEWAKLIFAAMIPAMAATAQVPQPAPAPETKAPPAAAPKNLDWPQLARYSAANAALTPDPARVVFYGDSITDAWVRNGGRFFPGKPYVNRGISGQTTPQMLVRFRQDVINLHPATVIILAGTNDIAGNTGPSTQEMIADNFRSMTELARANGIRVIIASVLPAADYPWKPGMDPAQKIVALNKWLAAYCAEQHITYLDYFTAMAAPDGSMKPGISIDGVHPNAAGYAIMEPLAQAALDQVPPK
jgi:lysophospholipase L1-like esterase